MIFLCLLSAFAAASDHLMALSPANFENVVLQRGPGESFMVMFHVSWCSVCKKTLPVFREAGDAARKDPSIKGVTFAEFDATNDKTIPQSLGSAGWPFIVYFGPSTAANAESNTKPIVFQSHRQVPYFLDFAKRMSGPAYHILHNVDEYEAVVSGENLTHFVLITQLRKNEQELPISFLRICDMFKHKHTFLVSNSPEFSPVARSNCKEAKRDCLLAISPQTSQFQPEKRAFAVYPEPLTNMSAIQSWVESSRFPGFWKLELLMFFEFSNSPKRTVLIVLDLKNEGTSSSAIRAVRQCLDDSQLASEFQFGVLDGIQNAEAVLDFNVKVHSLPRVVVVEPRVQGFFEDEAFLQLSNLSLGLYGIVEGALEKKQIPDHRSGIFGRVASMLYKNIAAPVAKFAQTGTKEMLLTVLALTATSFLFFIALWGCLEVCLFEDTRSHVNKETPSQELLKPTLESGPRGLGRRHQAIDQTID